MPGFSIENVVEALATCVVDHEIVVVSEAVVLRVVGCARHMSPPMYEPGSDEKYSMVSDGLGCEGHVMSHWALALVYFRDCEVTELGCCGEADATRLPPCASGYGVSAKE
jgi:hypothetical protein